MSRRSCPLLRLPNDILREILDHIEADPDRLVNLDRRGYLSQESFALPPLSTPNQGQDIGNVRLVCKALAELGAIHQFARITTRFSYGGFERLEKIAAHPHLAKHVKKFSYLLPHFFVEGRTRVRELIPRLDPSLGSIDAASFERKIREQRDIVRRGYDAKALSNAAAAFTGLQHIQILRLQDREDGVLLAHLRRNPELTRLVELTWAPSCSHCSATLGNALLKSRSPCSRFSIPALVVHPPSNLVDQIPQGLRVLAKNLKSLELHFDEGLDLQAKMQSLSGFFKEMFNTAESMQAIHIGFPSHRPLEMKLEDIFHHVKWERLSAFGIQAWKVDADEIISLVGRHRERLRGLRLRDVLLNQGSRWADVLRYLHDEMPQLDWVSLRRIGYTETFNRQWTGAEIPEDPPGGGSDSDSEVDLDAGSERDDDSRGAARRRSEDFSDDDDDDDASDTYSDDDGEHGPHAHEMGFPQLAQDRLAASRLQPRQDVNLLEWNELGDDGETVSNAQRKIWEKWVVSRQMDPAGAR